MNSCNALGTSSLYLIPYFCIVLAARHVRRVCLTGFTNSCNC